MSFLWSDPTPSNQTPAALGAGFHVDSASIGPLISSLLSYRAHQQAQRDKQMNDLIKGISSGVSRAYGEYQHGQADDAANAATYAALYPEDASGGFSDPNRVPDYGGTDALKALEAARHANPNLFADPLKQEYERARIDSVKALAEQRRSGGGENDFTGGPNTVWDDEGREWRQGSGGRWYPIKGASGPNEEPPADFPDATTKADKDRLANAKRGIQPPRNVAPNENMLPSHVSPIPSPAEQGQSQDTAYGRAVQILKDNNKPLTDANIKYVMGQLGK